MRAATRNGKWPFTSISERRRQRCKTTLAVRLCPHGRQFGR